MPNIKCVVEYEGTGYAGFQHQRRRDRPTIQSELEAAIVRLTGARARVIGAGRTDAGVHALGQVVNFASESRIPVERWPHALNSVLPEDIVVKAAQAVPDDFHAVRSARSKVYRYTIWNAPFPSVLWRRFAHFVSAPLAVESIREAGQALLGTHDFAAFRAAGGSARTSVRTVYRFEVSREGQLIHLTAEASGFLYRMMRIIAGTLLEVGVGKREPGDVARLLQAGKPGRPGPTAPAHGLCLVEVKYEP